MELFICFGFLVFFELFFFRIARSHDIVDKPNQRSSHSKPTIRGGGIIFPVAAVCWFIIYREHAYFIIALILISTISFLDDIRNVSNRLRLLVQFFSVTLLIYDTGLMLTWYEYFFLFVIIVGMINAYNFMDGINGITGLYSLGWLISIAIVTRLFYPEHSLQLVWIEMIAVLVFLFFNFRKKAACFAGDIGSVSIAFIGCYMLIKLMILMNSSVPILFIALYGVDSAITIFFRLLRKENIFRAHRSHLYQVLVNEYKTDHRLVAAGYLAIQLLVNAWVLFAYITWQLPSHIIFLQVFGLLSVSYLLFRIRLQNWKTLTGSIK